MFHGGPGSAAKTGLTVSLALVILAFGTNWVVPNEPRFASQVSVGEHQAVRDEFRLVFYLSVLATTATVAVTVVGIALVIRAFPAMALRLLPPWEALILLSGVIGAVAIRNMSAYCRAFCVDPTAVPLAVGGGVVLLLGATVGVLGTGALAASYAVGIWGVALPWSGGVFVKIWRSTAQD
jgi:hypothetical protein